MAQGGGEVINEKKLAELLGKEFHDESHCNKCRAFPEMAATIEAALKVIPYAVHGDKCILMFWEAGEPTANGGYRTKIKGKWYQSKPIDETPKCDCGFAEVFAPFHAPEEEK